jgi:hypothetical protein
VVGPAYAVGFGGFSYRRGGCRLIAVLRSERLPGKGSVSALTPYRPPPLRTEIVATHDTTGAFGN